MSDQGALARQCVPTPEWLLGANDGVIGDPVADLILNEKNWKGLLIEPVPYCFDRLQRNYPDRERFICEQIAIDLVPSRLSFYYVDERAKQEHPGLPLWHDQLGSFSRKHILNHLDGFLEPFIVETMIEARPLSDVLRSHSISTITLLHIDTEGHDLRALQSLDFSVVNVRGIFVEHKHLSPQDKISLRQLLRSQGFRIHDCGHDYFAQRT